MEEDPAAAFLAREQEDLADIAGDALGGLDTPAQTTVSAHLEVGGFETEPLFPCLDPTRDYGHVWRWR